MKCIYHPDRQAVTGCTRCGRALCEECAAMYQPVLCDDCFDMLTAEYEERSREQTRTARQQGSHTGSARQQQTNRGTRSVQRQSTQKVTAGQVAKSLSGRVLIIVAFILFAATYVLCLVGGENAFASLGYAFLVGGFPYGWRALRSFRLPFSLGVDSVEFGAHFILKGMIALFIGWFFWLLDLGRWIRDLFSHR